MKTFFLDFSMGHQLSHKSAACKTPPSAKHEVTQRESVPCEANRSEEQRPLSSAHPDHAGQAAPEPRRWMVGMPSAVSNDHTCLVWAQWRNTLPHTTGSPEKSCSRQKPLVPQQPHSFFKLGQPLSGAGNHSGFKTAATPGFKGNDSLFQTRKVPIFPL